MKEFPEIFWRSKSNNPINKFYLSMADGYQKTGEWDIFWMGINDYSKLNECINFAVSKQQTISYNMSKKISIIGGRGFTGQELIKLIDSHPQFELAQAFSSSMAGKEIMIDKRKLKKTYALLDQNTEFVEEDAFILALPNNEAAKWVDKISKQNSKAIIVDLSADHRFDDEWYYSVPELTQTIDGNKISNPGCYATAMQLMLAPINKMIDGEVNFLGFLDTAEQVQLQMIEMILIN